uniref:Uncharacterized protein n=1 Tax=Anguilla anguilla TaxID=7936 RepID=A0A0E9WSA9_ANGAN
MQSKQCYFLSFMVILTKREMMLKGLYNCGGFGFERHFYWYFNVPIEFLGVQTNTHVALFITIFIFL